MRELMLWVAMMGMHLGLARQAEEFLVAGRVALTNGGEVLVFVAE